MNTTKKRPIDLAIMGSRIQQLRDHHGLTQASLADSANLSYTYISQIEGGYKIPSLEALITIAQILNTSPDYLLYGSEDSQSATAIVLRILSDCSDSDQKLLLEFLLSAKELLERHDHITSESEAACSSSDCYTQAG